MNESNKKYYCFIRLYQTEYRTMLAPGAVLAKVNKLITIKSKNNKQYTHAAINYQLNDNFVGINMSLSGDDVRIENLRTMDNEKNAPQDRKTSTFDVFYLKLTKEEYDLLKSTLIKVKINKNIKYNFLHLLVVSKDSILKKIGTFFSTSKESNDVIDINNMAVICSTFVAWVLSKISRKYNEYFRMNDIDIYSVTPNDLTYLPGAVYMYGGYWKEYATLTRKYIAEHKEFEQFI